MHRDWIVACRTSSPGDCVQLLNCLCCISHRRCCCCGVLTKDYTCTPGDLHPPPPCCSEVFASTQSNPLAHSTLVLPTIMPSYLCATHSEPLRHTDHLACADHLIIMLSSPVCATRSEPLRHTDHTTMNTSRAHQPHAHALSSSMCHTQ